MNIRALLQAVSRREVPPLKESTSGGIGPTVATPAPAVGSQGSGSAAAPAVAGRGEASGDLLNDWESKVRF